MNIGTPWEGTSSTQAVRQTIPSIGSEILADPLQSYAFEACNAVASDFKLFFSFDYNGGTDGAWTQDDIIEILQTYAANGCHFRYDDRAFVSTFEGTTTDEINAWPNIRAAVDGGIYFIPDWTSLGPNGFDTSLVDGACT